MVKLLDTINIGVLTAILILLISYIVFLIVPIETVEFNSPYRVETPIIKQGENMRYVRDLEKFISAEGTMSCVFQDGLTYALPTKNANLAIGTYKDKVEIQIPMNLPPSTYIYKCSVTYRLLGIKEIRREFETEPFRVVR
jgi:hypothetical protein